MPIDINQFLQTFVEESLEMLQETEKALLAIELDALDMDKINLIFRSVHSIKSSSAIFEFTAISEFSHTLETFLDQVRSEKQKIEEEHINLLLESVDCLRSIITNIQEKKRQDDSCAIKLNHFFKEKILTEVKQEPVREDSEQNLAKIASEQEESLGWDISFHPNRSFFQEGNEPYRLFSVLAELGKLEVEIDINHLPFFPNFDPTECYLIWELKLHGKIPKKDVEEVFAWLVNKEYITIVPITAKKERKTRQHGDEETTSTLTHPTSIRVATEKIDNLINLVGELVIAQSILNQVMKDFNMRKIGSLYEGLAYLENYSRELQASVMRIRMVPIEFIFNRIPRFVHDTATKMDKEIELVITGEQTELDKTMMEKLNDPLLHLVRNAIDHGIETVAVRKKLGKPSKGTIQLDAYQEGGNIVIDVIDDGAGLNKEKIRHKAINAGLINEQDVLTDEKTYQLILQPGFSTADTVSDVSGRGVGLDVVYRNIKELEGEITIESTEGVGSTFSLRLPLTLAIMDCQLAKLADEIYIIPLTTITEIIKILPEQINQLNKKTNMYYFRGDYIPVVFLRDIFGLPNTNDFENKYIIVVDINYKLVGLVVDELLSQQQIVIKSLEDNYGKIEGISGVTILGDGRVALIVDVKTIVEQIFNPSLLEKQRAKTTNIDNEGAGIDNQQQDLAALQEGENAEKSFQFLSFLLQGREYGVDLLEVKEIRMWEEATQLPHTPFYIKGVINVRGIIIPVVDLRERLGLEPATYDNQTAIIILTIRTNSKPRDVGIIVDSVTDTYTISYNEIQPLPDSHDSELKEHILGLVTINDKMITIIKTKNLISVAVLQEKAS